MIHRVHSTNLLEVNRVLELIQKQVGETVTAQVAKATSAGGGTTTGTSVVGPAGPTGPAGADGVMDVDKLVIARTEEEEIVVTNAGSVVTDSNGWAVTGIKEQWALVTDNNGNILTLE